MRNVDRIFSFGGKKLGLVGAMEWGATLEVRPSGKGHVEYQGKVYFATAEQIADVKKLPQVRHMRKGIYLIPKKWRKPWGDSKYWESEL